MSKVIPFPALLPDPKLAPKIICPPYDVISSAEAREVVKDNLFSLLHITKAEVDLEPDIAEYDERIYQKALENFIGFQKEGWLVRDQESFYIYRMEMEGHVQTGIVCGVSVDEYDAGLIKRHEKTRKPKEDDRTRFAATIGAHAEPVFLTFQASASIKGLIAAGTKSPPLYDITDKDGVRHVLWRATSAEGIEKAFGCVTSLYVADGHHRSEAASRVRAMMREKNQDHTGLEPYNFFPAVLIPHDQVRVYRYDWDGDPKGRPLADAQIADIMALADRGGIMPPKSTWFAPKLASGFFVYTF